MEALTKTVALVMALYHSNRQVTNIPPLIKSPGFSHGDSSLVTFSKPHHFPRSQLHHHPTSLYNTMGIKLLYTKLENTHYILPRGQQLLFSHSAVLPSYLAIGFLLSPLCFGELPLDALADSSVSNMFYWLVFVPENARFPLHS